MCVGLCQHVYIYLRWVGEVREGVGGGGFASRGVGHGTHTHTALLPYISFEQNWEASAVTWERLTGERVFVVAEY